MEKVLSKPEKPLTAIIGGAKISGKINVIENLFDMADNIIVGGGMSYTFIKAQGGKIGNSLVEDDQIETAIRKIGNSSFVIEQSAWQHDEQCALGKTIVVRYDFDNKKAQALSESEKNMLSEHLLAE